MTINKTLQSLLNQATTDANDESKRPLSSIYGSIDSFITKGDVDECQAYYARITRNATETGYLVVHFEHDGVTPLSHKAWIDDALAGKIGFEPTDLDNKGYVVGYTIGQRDPATIIECDRIA